MGRRDVKSQTQLAVLHATAAVTATQSIQGTEVADFNGAAFAVHVPDHTTDGLEVTFQHRDGEDAWEDIPAENLDGDNDIAIVEGQEGTTTYVGYTGNKEQIGAVITDTDAGDAQVGVYVLKGYPNRFPVND